MKKSKIFIAAGGVVLALVAVFTTKANKKFTQYSVAYIKGTSTSVTITNFFTTTNTRPQVYLRTGATAIYTLVSSTAQFAGTTYLH